MNTTIIYDNYNGYDFDKIKQLMIEDHIEENQDNMTWVNYNPTDNQVLDYSYFLQDTDYRDTMLEFDLFFKYNTLIVSSEDERINGKILDSTKDLEDLMDDCDYVIIKDENGDLKLSFCRHNGNFYHTELKALTVKGLKYLEDHNRDFLEDEDIEKLLSLTEKANFAKKIYGC